MRFEGRWAWLTLLVVASLLAASCTGGDAGAIGDSIPPVDTTRGATTATESSTTDPTSTTSEVPVSDPDDLEALWADLWTASALPIEERAPAIAELGGGVDPVVAEGVPTMVFESQVSDVFTFPVFTKEDVLAETVTIRDCILYVPEIFESTGHVHSGTAVPDGEGGWIIESVLRETRGCVPAPMAEEILADYEEFWAARKEYTNPPDPDHPGIDRTMTGGHKDLIRGRVTELLENGHVLVRDKTEFYPEISELHSNTRIEIQDCTLVDPGAGVFDENGDYIEGTEARTPGVRDLYTVAMTLEGGQWKTDHLAVRIDEDCQHGPTPAGLRIIGPEQ